MSGSLRTFRAATAMITSTVVLVGAGSTQLAAAESVTATSSVNIRSGPGTSYRIVGGLVRGQSITRLAKAEDGWVKVRFNGSTAYVASKYLAASGKNLPPAPTTIYTNGVKIATVALNVRDSPSTKAAIVGYISEGQRVTLTGKLSRGFAEILYGGSRQWVSAQYLATASTLLPRVTGTRVARADLNLWTMASGSAATGEVPKGAKLGVTGVLANGRAQIVYRNAIRWVTARYLSNTAVSQPSAPKLPKVVGSRYATTALNIRSSPSGSYTLIREVPRGTTLAITGKITNGRMQIVYSGVVRWVTAAYLSSRKPSGSSGGSGGSGGSGVNYAVERGLSANAIKVHRAALRAFPQIRTYYGVRPDSIPDHPSGHALDLMLPYSNYKSATARAFGVRVRDWARANARSLGIEYVIYDQHIWNIQRDREGWRYMADRGSDSANHKNHVHITVY